MALDVIIVSHGDGAWLGACLRSLRARSGGAQLEIVIVENGGEVHDRGALGSDVEVIEVDNRGFGAANNVGLKATSGEFALLLNPDTEIASGTLAAAVAEIEARQDVGLLAVRQLDGDGQLFPSIRRFPRVRHLVANALGVERLPVLRDRLGERVLAPSAYDRLRDIDWTTGAVMLVRREAMSAVGGFDERYFLFSEETDLARRLRDAGWRAVHSPVLEVVHHAGKAGVHPRREAQMAYARMQYARAHSPRLQRAAYQAVLISSHALRSLLRRDPEGRRAARYSLAVLLGRRPQPYGSQG